eukprot:TRINITY_DN2848_c1_g1_i1.p3 TRINITY_DN2848_c1_g1~~TRINITY_DN2848_c1_g1_i1.p3  ORF type:complete len:119 (+),score=6.73 TRINITY_DN2848_c1_g1_i1:108-464(+)
MSSAAHAAFALARVVEALRRVHQREPAGHIQVWQLVAEGGGKVAKYVGQQDTAVDAAQRHSACRSSCKTHPCCDFRSTIRAMLWRTLRDHDITQRCVAFVHCRMAMSQQQCIPRYGNF